MHTTGRRIKTIKYRTNEAKTALIAIIALIPRDLFHSILDLLYVTHCVSQLTMAGMTTEAIMIQRNKFHHAHEFHNPPV